MSEDSKALRILDLEDDPLDAELIHASLIEGGISCEITRVQTRADFLAALEGGGFDIVLSDYSLPSFDGLSALNFAEEICPEVPFILVSGAIGEEKAIETLKSGATDYVLKQRLDRLVPAVRRAVREVDERTERKRAEQEIRFQARLLDAVGQAVIATDPEGKIVYWNRGAQEMYGLSVEEVMGRPIIDVVPSEELLEQAGEIMAELQAGRSWSGEFMVRRKDGTTFPAFVTDTPVHDERGALVAIIGVSTDITEIKQTEELRRSEERFRLLVDGVKDYAIFMLDTEGHIISWNAGAQRINGYRAEEILGRHFSLFYVAEDIGRGHPEEELRLAQEQGRYEEEGLRVRKDGSRFWASVLITALTDDEGNLRGFSKVVRDVTDRKEVEKKHREAEERYRTLVERIPAIVYVEQMNGRMTTLYDSPQIEIMLGYPRDTYEKDPDYWMKIIHPDDRARVLTEDQAATGEDGQFSSEYRVLASDGRVVWVRDEAVVVWDQEGEPLYWQGFIFDITNQKEAEEAMRRSEASLAESQRMAHLGTWEWDVKTDEVWWSDETFRIYGFEPYELVPTFEKLVEVVHPEDRNLLRDSLAGALYEHKSYDFEHRILRPCGEVRWVHRQAEVVRGEAGEPLRMIGTVHDITERKVLEEKLRHQAFHDLLTNLPNRYLFVDRLKQALRRTRRRRGSRVAVLFMDLDGFKFVNDSVGHGVGDRLLVGVSERLKKALHPGDTLARFGGDEFVVLLEEVEGPEGAVRVAERITHRLREPLLVEGRELFVRASIGIALGDDRQKSSEDLLRDADTAMYRAKDEGLAYKMFDEAMYERALDRLELENDLRRAIEREEFVVHYQPIVNLHTGQLWGLEALVRWDHPTLGLLDPEAFVPVAEESGLVVPLGEQVLGEACRQVVEWQRDHPNSSQLVVSVNLSGRQLRRPDLQEVIEHALKESGLSASSLSLDITETVYISALEADTAVLDRLKALGIRISIDDFGSGYSSLSYLKRLPADVLKIDKAFARGLGVEVEDTAIAQTIIDLAHILGMKVVVEGVEVEEQETLLKEMGCDLGQGYHFSKPLPPEEVGKYLGGSTPRRYLSTGSRLNHRM